MNIFLIKIIMVAIALAGFIFALTNEDKEHKITGNVIGFICLILFWFIHLLTQ